MATKKTKKIEKDRSGYMGREYTLYVSATGAVFIREKGDVLGVEGFLPFFSAETHESADMLRVRHCRLSRTPPSFYVINDFVKDSLKCVNAAADAFAKTYEEFTSKNLYGLDSGEKEEEEVKKKKARPITGVQHGQSRASIKGS